MDMLYPAPGVGVNNAFGGGANGGDEHHPSSSARKRAKNDEDYDEDDEEGDIGGGSHPQNTKPRLCVFFHSRVLLVNQFNDIV